MICCRFPSEQEQMHYEKDPLATAKDELVLQIISEAEAKVKKSNIKTVRNSTDDVSDRKEKMDLASDGVETAKEELVLQIISEANFFKSIANLGQQCGRT